MENGPGQARLSSENVKLFRPVSVVSELEHPIADLRV